MRTIFLPSLLNSLTGDPGVWVDLMDEGRSVLLDLGSLAHVASRKLLRVERVVVTHTHLDHFVGFDHLLRLVLGREKELTVTGPAGFLDRVQGKISAYTWNLIRDYPVRLRAEEVVGGSVRSVLYTGERGFEPEPLPERHAQRVVHAERLFTVHVAELDHGIPVLGVSLRETVHLSVNRDRLEREGLAPGPWLRDLKAAVRRCEPLDADIEASAVDGSARRYRRGELADALIIKQPGQRLSYVTDIRFTPDNVARVAELAAESDLLICEAAFLHEDEALARQRNHLTARQAGELARAAGAHRLAPCHLSPRYKDREQEIFEEAEDAFGGPVLRLTNETA